jgi:hypothetical protein
MSRVENAFLREVIRLRHALFQLWKDSYEWVPSTVMLDVGDTVDVVHGGQRSRCQCPLRRALLSGAGWTRTLQFAARGDDLCKQNGIDYVFGLPQATRQNVSSLISH